MKKTLLIGFAVALLPVCAFLWIWSHTESHCFLYPGIDTHYAPGYSESAFSQVSTGMTIQAVEKLLGSPLHSHTDKDGRLRWCYTGDGKCSGWADFAWLGREIFFRDDRVVEVFKHVYYD